MIDNTRAATTGVEPAFIASLAMAVNIGALAGVAFHPTGKEVVCLAVATCPGFVFGKALLDCLPQLTFNEATINVGHKNVRFGEAERFSPMDNPCGDRRSYLLPTNTVRLSLQAAEAVGALEPYSVSLVAREQEGDSCAAPVLARHRKRASEASHDLYHRRQPQPAAERLRREEWLADPRSRRRVHPAARVGHFQIHIVACREVGRERGAG